MAATMTGIQPTPDRNTRAARAAGATLPELLVTVAIAAALTALAAPALTGMVESQKRLSAVHAFVASLQLARSEAIKRNARAVLCKSADGASCSASGGWEQGWIVFQDRNNNAAFDAGEALVLRRGPLPAGMRLSGNQPVARYVSYSAIGTPKLTSGAFQAGTFTLCAAQGAGGAQARQIILSRTGNARIYPGAAGACV